MKSLASATYMYVYAHVRTKTAERKACMSVRRASEQDGSCGKLSYLTIAGQDSWKLHGDKNRS